MEDIVGESVNSDDIGNSYSFYIDVVSSDGTSITTKVHSMELVRYYYDPNPAPEGGWTDANTTSPAPGVITNKWQDNISNLSFASGDRLETFMDLRNCTYIYKSGSNAADVGLDNILSIGLTTIEGGTPPSGRYHIYYPSITKSDPDPAKQGARRFNIHANKWSTAYVPSCADADFLVLRLDNDGITYSKVDENGNYINSISNPPVGDWDSSLKASFAAAGSLVIGSKEGVHRSRAIYRYIRVIRVRDL